MQRKCPDYFEKRKEKKETKQKPRKVNSMLSITVFTILSQSYLQEESIRPTVSCPTLRKDKARNQ